MGFDKYSGEEFGDEAGRRVAETIVDQSRVRGRGAASNAVGRFEGRTRQDCDDGWGGLEDLPPFKTEVRIEESKGILSTNKSPDIPFDQSINPYRGCEHGCSYCFARPTHAYWGLSPGLDFETKLTARVNAAALLEQALAKKGYVVSPIALGANTDPYQPIERDYKITRQILTVLAEAKHPFTIVTKSELVLRDLDILAALAQDQLVSVAISVTTLDRRLARAMEPRASAPHRRLSTLRALSEAGVPTMVLAAPVIPALNDHELEKILEVCFEAGARRAGYVLLRLPLEISDLFRDWLRRVYPDRAARVMSLLQSMRGGKDYDASFGTRQRGEGVYADLIARRFQLATSRLGFNVERQQLRSDLFNPPVPVGGQFRLC